MISGYKDVMIKGHVNAIEQLCQSCGLCCDGTLFADVELRAGDDAKQLTKLGLALHQKSKTKLAFPQPCACFDGQLCNIYTDRPKRCRRFECGLLKKTAAGEMTAEAALRKILFAKKRAAKVRNLLHSLGQRDENAALTRRYSEAMRAPMDLSNIASADARGELMLAMDDLMTVLQRDFLSASSQ